MNASLSPKSLKKMNHNTQLIIFYDTDHLTFHFLFYDIPKYFCCLKDILFYSRMFGYSILFYLGNYFISSFARFVQCLCIFIMVNKDGG